MAPMEAAIREEPTDWSAIMMLAVGATMISFSSVFVRVADVGPVAAGFYRCFFGAIVLLPAAFWRRRTLPRGWRDLLLIAACGAVFTLDLSAWHQSIHWIGPGLATILGNFQVFVLTVIGAVFFKEKLNRWSYFSIGIAFGGLAFLVEPNWDRLGDLEITA